MANLKQVQNTNEYHNGGKIEEMILLVCNIYIFIFIYLYLIEEMVLLVLKLYVWYKFSH